MNCNSITLYNARVKRIYIVIFFTTMLDFAGRFGDILAYKIKIDFVPILGLTGKSPLNQFQQDRGRSRQTR